MPRSQHTQSNSPPFSSLDLNRPASSDTHLQVQSNIGKASRPKSKSLQPCRCPREGCGKIFSKRSNLKAHMRIHDGVLPYPCMVPGCTKRFRWKSSLKPHIKVHKASGDEIPPDILNPAPITTPSVLSPNPVSAPKPLCLPPPTFSSVHPSTRQDTFTPNTLRPSCGPLPSPSEMLSLPLDQVPSKEARIDAGSPTTITDTRHFEKKPIVPSGTSGLKDLHQGRYTCPHVGCNLKFSRLSEMTEHERNTYHADRRPPVMRRLFGDSHVSEVKMVNEVDLNCNSALSSPVGSAGSSDDTDVGSLTLESSVCTTEEPIGFSRGGTEELWKTEIPLMEDPLDDPYLVFGGGYREGLGQWMMASAPAEQTPNVTGEWMMPSTATVGVQLEEVRTLQ